ncbi:MAG: T9SS type A sorting domain-containing protein [bacterium]
MKTYINMLVVGLVLTLTFVLFAETPIRTSSNKDREAAIAYNSTNDEYLVVWTEYTPPGSATLPIMAQRVKGDGSGFIGSPFTVFPLGVYPSVAYNSQTNEYLVTAAAFGVVEAQRVGNTGTLEGAWTSLMSMNNAIWPTIVYNSLDNSYLLIATTLYDAGFSLCNIKVHSLRVAANGQPGGNINVIRDQGYGPCDDGSNYAIAYAPITAPQTPKGRFLLAIQAPDDLTMLDHNGVIVSKVIDSQQGGAIVDDHVPFQQSKVGIAHNVDVAFGNWEGEDVFMVVWGDIDQNVNNVEWTGIWAGIVNSTPVEFDAHGGVSNTVFPVSRIPFHWATPSHADTWRPVVAYNTVADKFMIAWRETPSTDPNNATKVNHIRANAVDSPTIPPPANIVLSAVTGNEDPKAPAIAASTKNANALVVWEDARNFATTDIDLYGNLFNTTPAKTLQLTAPNGGEKWQVGSQQQIKWQSNGIGNFDVKIEYSTNNGAAYTFIAFHTNTDGANTHNWTVPNSPSNQCLVRISVSGLTDVSDAIFEITAPAEKLTLVTPNGGENWQVGAQQEIKWTSSNFTAPVHIEYSIDGNASHLEVVSSTANDGSYLWTIPNTPSSNCVVIISDASDGNPFDISNSTFTISASGNTPAGKNVHVGLGNGIDLTFDDVAGAGNTTVNVTQTGSPPPNGFLIFPAGAPKYYNITTTAAFTGNIKICIKYDDSSLTPIEESKLRFYVYETTTGKWKDITTSLDTQNNIICGTVSHLSEFAMMLGPTHFTFASNTGESYSVVIDNATLDGNQLTNGDEIGVFTPSGLCVGAAVWDGATPLALTAWADNSQTNDVDGYNSGEKMSFKIWDASAGTQDDYPATPTYSAGNGNFGDGAFTRISLLEAVTSVTQVLALTQGWSWMSINVEPQNQSMESVMAGMANLVIVVNNAGQFYIPNVINSIGNLSALEGYKIYVSTPAQVSVTGKPVTATTPIALTAGWNFVSYLPSTAMSAETALASVVSQLAIIKNDAGKFFIPNVINSLGNMTPGKGYKLYLNADATLTYPQGSSLAKTHTNRLTTPGISSKHFAFRQRTGESFSVVVKSTGQRFKPGDEIGIFTPGGLCVGAGVWDDAGLIGISAWADDDRTDVVDGFRYGEMMQFKLWDTEENREVELNAVFTSGSDRFDEDAFAVVELASPALPTTFSLGQNYPNPFNAGTVISYQLPESGRLTLKIYNLLGEQVRMLLNETQEAGSYTVHWDGKDHVGKFVPSGVYLYRIQAGSYTATRKAVFVK